MFGLFKKKSDIDVNAFISASVSGLEMVTTTHCNTWRLGKEESWNIDQDDGQIIFTFSDGIVASAPVQIVGTFNANDETFMWGWNHPSVVPALQKNALLAKKFGQENGVAELMTQKVSCTENRAWEFTALALRLSEGSGAYRGEANPGTFVFLNFGEIHLTKRT